MINFTVETQQFKTFADEAIRELNGPQQEKFFRAAALRLASAFIRDTPVDTGRARGGWTAVPGVSSSGDAAAVAQGRGESSYTERGLKSSHPEVEIINGVPYIIPLELGSSLQAPAGFIRINMRKFMGELVRGSVRRTEAALRLANAKARARHGLTQGLGPRGVGRAGRL